LVEDHHEVRRLTEREVADIGANAFDTADATAALGFEAI
jgi:hypothetical protein